MCGEAGDISTLITKRYHPFSIEYLPRRIEGCKNRKVHNFRLLKVRKRRKKDISAPITKRHDPFSIDYLRLWEPVDVKKKFEEKRQGIFNP